jgi:hypothetical protein
VGDFVNDVANEVIARAGASWGLLGALVALVVIAVLAVTLRRIHLDPADPPEATPPDMKPTDPPSSWGANVKPNDGPPGGDLGGG